MSNVDAAKFALHAFSQGDLATLKELHSEDAVYELHGFGTPGRWYHSDTMRPHGEVCGRDAIIDIFVQLMDHCNTMITEPREFIDGGEYVGVLGTQRLASHNTGSEEFPFVLVLIFGCDGRVVRAQFHADSARIGRLAQLNHRTVVGNPDPPATTSWTGLPGTDVQRRSKRRPGLAKRVHANVI